MKYELCKSREIILVGGTENQTWINTFFPTQIIFHKMLIPNSACWVKRHFSEAVLTLCHCRSILFHAVIQCNQTFSPYVRLSLYTLNLLLSTHDSSTHTKPFARSPLISTFVHAPRSPACNWWPQYQATVSFHCRRSSHNRHWSLSCLFMLLLVFPDHPISFIVPAHIPEYRCGQHLIRFGDRVAAASIIGCLGDQYTKDSAKYRCV